VPIALLAGLAKDQEEGRATVVRSQRMNHPMDTTGNVDGKGRTVDLLLGAAGPVSAQVKRAAAPPRCWGRCAGVPRLRGSSPLLKPRGNVGWQCTLVKLGAQSARLRLFPVLPHLAR
jgi:hypothetical protein